jgi:hypothetical protein
MSNCGYCEGGADLSLMSTNLPFTYQENVKIMLAFEVCTPFMLSFTDTAQWLTDYGSFISRGSNAPITQTRVIYCLYLHYVAIFHLTLLSHYQHGWRHSVF